jgi:hypothetical protein
VQTFDTSIGAELHNRSPHYHEEMLQRAGMTPAGAIDAIVAVLAALLLPASVVVPFIARASNSGAET